MQLLLPDLAAAGDGLGYAQALLRPLGDIDSRLSELFGALVAPDDAAGPALDFLGDQVNEARGGLGDAEYRRIIAGRRVASSKTGGVTAPRVMAGWQALTGSSELRLTRLPPYGIHLTARVSVAPTGTWLVRAVSVVKALVSAKCAVNATVYTGDSAIFDSLSLGYDVGLYAWDLPILVP